MSGLASALEEGLDIVPTSVFLPSILGTALLSYLYGRPGIEWPMEGIQGHSPPNSRREKMVSFAS